MKWFDLIFSDQRSLRYRRHVIFWITWWIYFAGSYFFTQQGFDQAGSAKWIFIILVKSFLLLLCHIFIVYVSVYLLLPCVQQRRWMAFAIVLPATIAITIAWGYFCYSVLFPALDNKFQISSVIIKKVLLWNSITAGLISSLKTVIAALGIKLLKYWYLKQKENERLKKEKIALELQLLKAQIQPDILFSSLDSIYTLANNNTSKASELLLKLSDLLSYVLYECDQPEVQLEKELKMIRDYMALQKKRMNDQLEVSIIVKGNAGGKMIAPLLLLPFLENSISYCNHQKLEKTWVNLEVKIEGDELFIKLVNGKSAAQKVPAVPEENGLANVHKRLQLLYPGRNEMKIHAEPEVMMTYLKLKLDAPVFETNNEINK